MKKFTLIELLIVIAIIGILASILLPSLSKARAKARQSVCLSNQRQMHTAAFSYITKNNNFAPYDNHLSGAVDNWKNKTWFNRLIPDYLPEGTKVLGGASDVQFCPDGRQEINKWSSTISMNTLMSGFYYQSWNIKPEFEHILNATPDETMIFMDSHAATRGIWQSQMNETHLINASAEDRIARHLGKANVTFLDGHATSQNYQFFLDKNNDHTFFDPQQ